MRKVILGLAGCLSAGLLWAAQAKYQPLNIKPGLWETTSVTKISGRPPISDEMLAQMSPEQRARFEAAMGQMANQPPRTRVAKKCVTEKDLKEDPFNDNPESCKETVVNSSGRKLDIHEVCSEQGAKVDVMVHIEAVDSENVKGTVQSNATGGSNTMTVSGTFKSKYVGAACKGNE